jgi:hypothetical protein
MTSAARAEYIGLVPSAMGIERVSNSKAFRTLSQDTGRAWRSIVNEEVEIVVSFVMPFVYVVAQALQHQDHMPYAVNVSSQPTVLAFNILIL